MKKNLFLMVIVLATFGVTKPVEIGGIVESYHSVKLSKEAEFIGERNQVQLDFRKISTNLFMLASLRGTHSPIILEDNFEFDVGEAYIEYYQSNWDIRIGRQIFNWGQADGIRITDVLSPLDYREFITRDFEEIRIPIEAVKGHFLFSMVDAELIWIPFFTPAILPANPDNPWYLGNPLSAMITSSTMPKRTLENSEVAARISLYFNSIDISFSASYVFDDMPVYRKTETGIVGEYNRMLVAGLGLAKPMGIVVARFEGAFIDGKHFSSKTGNFIVEKPSVKALVGIDIDPGYNLTISAQIANEQHIFEYDSTVVEDEENYLLTLNIEKSFLREKLKLSNMLYVGLQKYNLWERFSVSYALTDDFVLAGGVDIFEGDKYATLGQYDNNDAIWLKATLKL